MSHVLDAMFEKTVQSGEFIIRQGDDGDNFYIIEKWVVPLAILWKYSCYQFILLMNLLISCEISGESLRFTSKTRWYIRMTTVGRLANWLFCTICRGQHRLRPSPRVLFGQWIDRLSDAFFSNLLIKNAKCTKTLSTKFQCSNRLR